MVTYGLLLMTVWVAQPVEAFSPTHPMAYDIEHVRWACQPETDVACPQTREPHLRAVNGGDPSAQASRAPDSPWSQILRLRDWEQDRAAQRLWQYDDVQAASGNIGCAAQARVAWSAEFKTMSWLKIRVGEIQSMQPQGCAMAARVCLDC